MSVHFSRKQLHDQQMLDAIVQQVVENRVVVVLVLLYDLYKKFCFGPGANILCRISEQMIVNRQIGSV